MPTYYEFFAGGGMARAGLGERWQCLLANDIDRKKAAAYAENWGADCLRIGDVGNLTTADAPGGADLAWASFPCQDLSLAGDYVGLQGKRSGTFWSFWSLMEGLADEGRAPSVIVLENVCGALTSHQGRDFEAIGSALARREYSFGALVIDAAHFLPQSRPRLFIVAVRKDRIVPQAVIRPDPNPAWHTPSLIASYRRLNKTLKTAWIWWNLPAPPLCRTKFADILEDSPRAVAWHTPAQTERLLSLMSPSHREKVEQAKNAGTRATGAVYRRTRNDDSGNRIQRAEIRFDGLAGCLRTPAGGSSRQTILIVEGEQIRSRLLSPREAARLMGLPENYKLPRNYNEAYHLVGDGVAVPVVRFLAAHLLDPLLETQKAQRIEAA